MTVKPQHRYVTRPPWHRLSPSFRFFYSNKNDFVQLEDTTIKTERCCSMHRTERTRAVHHSRSALPRLSRPDFVHGINFPNTTRFRSVNLWCNLNNLKGSGWSNNIPSRTSFQNSISALYSYTACTRTVMRCP